MNTPDELNRFAEHVRDVERARDLAQTQLRDMEKSLAVAEARAERLEIDLERKSAQYEDASKRLLELTTIWQAIGAAHKQGETAILQTASFLRMQSGHPGIPAAASPTDTFARDLSDRVGSPRRKFAGDDVTTLKSLAERMSDRVGHDKDKDDSGTAKSD